MGLKLIVDFLKIQIEDIGAFGGAIGCAAATEWAMLYMWTYSGYKLQTVDTHLSHLLVSYIPFPVLAFWGFPFTRIFYWQIDHDFTIFGIEVLIIDWNQQLFDQFISELTHCIL